jgi:alkylation response protein AidB-like acyl-CoA dehydrogenase
MSTLTHEIAISRARGIVDRVLAPLAAQNDKSGRFSTEAVDALGREELLGLMVPTEAGGSGLGARTFAALIATLAEADASVAMVYLMHVLGELRRLLRRGPERLSRPPCKRLLPDGT